MEHEIQGPTTLGTSQIHIFPGARFSCRHCATCCSVFLRIPIDEERLHNLAAGGLERIKAAHPELEHISPPCGWKSKPDDEAIVPRRADGACAFLGPDNLCMIHGVLGEQAKPQVCMDFPYVFRRAPAGLFVGLSFTCPSVQAAAGEPLDEQAAVLGEHARRAVRCDEIAESVRFDSRYSVSWAAYERLEAALRVILAREDVDLPQRLSAGHVLLSLLRVWLDARLGPAEELLAERQVPDTEIEAFVAANERTNFNEPFRIAARPRGQRAPRRTFLALVLACGASMWKTGKPLQAALGIVANYARAAAGLGKLTMMPLDSRYPYSVLEAPCWSGTGQAAELLNRYLQMCLFRKDLAAEALGIRRAFEHLLLRAALAGVYGAALTGREGADAPSSNDHASRALQIVETYYGHHSQLFALVETVPRLGGIFDSFFALRNYADTVLGRFGK
jgi:Fe-S-cluster containining protein